MVIGSSNTLKPHRHHWFVSLISWLSVLWRAFTHDYSEMPFISIKNKTLHYWNVLREPSMCLISEAIKPNNTKNMIRYPPLIIYINISSGRYLTTCTWNPRYGHKWSLRETELKWNQQPWRYEVSSYFNNTGYTRRNTVFQLFKGAERLTNK